MITPTHRGAYNRDVVEWFQVGYNQIKNCIPLVGLSTTCFMLCALHNGVMLVLLKSPNITTLVSGCFDFKVGLQHVRLHTRRLLQVLWINKCTYKKNPGHHEITVIKQKLTFQPSTKFELKYQCLYMVDIGTFVFRLRSWCLVDVVHNIFNSFLNQISMLIPYLVEKVITGMSWSTDNRQRPGCFLLLTVSPSSNKSPVR